MTGIRTLNHPHAKAISSRLRPRHALSVRRYFLLKKSVVLMYSYNLESPSLKEQAELDLEISKVLSSMYFCHFFP